MKRVLHLIDSHDYVRNNCFQHQLASALKKHEGIETAEIHNVLGRKLSDYDQVVSCLKQRTLLNVAPALRSSIGETPLVVYDQDPWEAFQDKSPYRGAYDMIMRHLNVKTFAVTTRWWADFLSEKGFPSTFVRMWVLPEYCNAGMSFEERTSPVGFIGSLHTYRRALFEGLEDLGINVIVKGGGLNYAGYLNGLSDIRCFIHSEDAPITVGGKPENLNVGLWIKDVEAMARGCFSIRNRGADSESYLQGLETIRLYDNIDEVPAILEGIEKMDPLLRQATITKVVEQIRGADHWSKTAAQLIA